MSDRAEWVSLDNYAHLKMQYEDAAAERDQLRADLYEVQQELNERSKSYDRLVNLAASSYVALEADLAAAHAEIERLRKALNLALEAIPKDEFWEHGQMTYFDAFCAALGILKTDRLDVALATAPKEGE